MLDVIERQDGVENHESGVVTPDSPPSLRAAVGSNQAEAS